MFNSTICLFFYCIDRQYSEHTLLWCVWLTIWYDQGYQFPLLVDNRSCTLNLNNWMDSLLSFLAVHDTPFIRSHKQISNKANRLSKTVMGYYCQCCAASDNMHGVKVRKWNWISVWKGWSINNAFYSLALHSPHRRMCQPQSVSMNGCHISQNSFVFFNNRWPTVWTTNTRKHRHLSTSPSEDYMDYLWFALID